MCLRDSIWQIVSAEPLLGGMRREQFDLAMLDFKTAVRDYPDLDWEAGGEEVVRQARMYGRAPVSPANFVRRALGEWLRKETKDRDEERAEAPAAPRQWEGVA